MPLNSLKTEEPTSPSSNSRFVVDLGNGLKPIAFQEISGLNAESKVLEYRNINSPHFTTEKMPGITKYDNIILKKAVLVADQTFWNWHDKHAPNEIFPPRRPSLAVRQPDQLSNFGRVHE